jgi:predicted Zn-dependent protease
MFRVVGTIALAVLGLFAAGTIAAQTGLVPPDEVVIYVHKDMKNTDFIEGLVCELGRVLVAPVRATTSDLPLYRSYLATPTQLDVGKVRVPFAEATTQDGSVFRYLILPYDLKAAGLNYVFSYTDGGDGSTVAIMSTIRLTPNEPGLSRKRISDVTGDRIYKLMLKSVAVLAGLRTTGCVMAFPRNLPELDQKAAEFCPDDRAALVAAGVLKDKPFGACSTVAMAGR